MKSFLQYKKVCMCMCVGERMNYHCVYMCMHLSAYVRVFSHASMRLCIHAHVFTQLSDTGQRHRHVLFVLPLAERDAVISS